MTDEYKPGETPYDIIAKAYALEPIDATFASFEPFDVGRYKAVNAFYEAGYITEEEAQGLIYNDLVERNKCTKIFINEHTNEFILSCFENVFVRSMTTSSMLFYLKYDKLTGFITSETNEAD